MPGFLISSMSDPPQTSSRTMVKDEQPTSTQTQTPPEQPVIRLRLRKPKTAKKVAWSANTVDNENMNKKKSKCCCVFEKTRQFGESSSDSDDECEHCRGHVELKKKDHRRTGEPAENPDDPQPGHSQT